MQNQKEQLSYALGMALLSNLQQQNFVDVDYDVLAQAMKDTAANAPKMTGEQANQAIASYQQNLNKQLAVVGEEFLAENAKRDDVTVTSSGLQYRVMRRGEGIGRPTATSTVTVHYEGRLIDGQVFDSSYQRGEKISFGLNQVIKGWTEGVQLMRVGDKFEFYVPYQLGYGERGAGGSIPPYAALIFVVELFEFK